MSKHPRYAVLGLGPMGSRIAKRPAALGHEVTGWNRAPHRDLAASYPGVQIKASPGQAVSGADAVLLRLHDANAVRDVAVKTDLVGSLTPDTVVIDMGTNDPETAMALGDMLRAESVFIDGPVSDGTVAAEDGTPAILLGADEPLAQHIAPLLAPLGNPAAFGRLGKGQAAEPANQVAITITVLGERAHDLVHGAMLVSARAALANAKQKRTQTNRTEICDHA